MINIFTVLYALFCLHLFAVSLTALLHMNKRTNHARRMAFLSIAVGSMLSFIELFESAPPHASALLVVVGMSTLFFVGSREYHTKQSQR